MQRDIPFDISTFQFAPDKLRGLVVKPYANVCAAETGLFAAWLEKLQSDDKRRIRKEFESLTVTLQNHGQSVESWKRHRNCNRYNDMPCFEKTRVVLDDGLFPNYVHANFINGFQRPNAYILTQGPLDNTIVDFWRMVWQENVATIVMVTRLEEKGRVKCARYFPVTSQKEFVAGIFKIDLLKVETRRLCVASLMAVTNLLNNSIRFVVHVWYSRWPDQGIPDDVVSLRHFLNYLKLINANLSKKFYQEKHQRGPPIIFHCSAGIGRSATLVALDIVTEGIVHLNHVDPYKLVVQMRQERFHTIHTKVQLLFVYNYIVTLAVTNRHQLMMR